MLAFFTPAHAASGWFDNPFRRPVEVIWDAEHGGGYELCSVEFYTGGHVNPDGSDLRVATEDGRQVAAKVLRVGPGDKVSLIFSLARGVKKYFVYFGNPAPPPNKPAFENVKIEAGLLLEMHEWVAGKSRAVEPPQTAWEKGAGKLIGSTMMDAPFYSFTPFGPTVPCISKMTGSLFAPLEGDYSFSMYVEDRGTLFIDGSQLLMTEGGRADVSRQARVHLKRGRHELVLYRIARAGGYVTVAWQIPGARGFEAIPRTVFGIYSRGIPGALEELRAPVVADFTVQYAGEFFYVEEYSQHYVFSAREPRGGGKAEYEWDFGDGQTASGPLVEHVYLNDGTYPLKLSVRLGLNGNSQTSKFVVSRDWAHIENPILDRVGVQSRIVSAYNVARLPPEALPRAVWLHERGGNLDAMLQAGTQLASLSKHPSADLALAALQGASRAAAVKNDAGGAVKMWSALPATSDLQPRAAGAFARLLLWQTGDIARAVQVLEPYGKDPALVRLYADALVLNQKAAEGRTLLESIAIKEEANRRAARSGALARTIEYYIKSADWETGEGQWDNWQQQYPADFMEGYSILLKVKLMELKGAAQAAATVAEAFARAVPGSSYAPQLLFKAGKLLETTAPAKSKELIELLKRRYPEDPLAQ
jgi:hypothetical protein